MTLRTRACRLLIFLPAILLLAAAPAASAAGPPERIGGPGYKEGLGRYKAKLEGDQYLVEGGEDRKGRARPDVVVHADPKPPKGSGVRNSSQVELTPYEHPVKCSQDVSPLRGQVVAVWTYPAGSSPNAIIGGNQDSARAGIAHYMRRMNYAINRSAYFSSGYNDSAQIVASCTAPGSGVPNVVGPLQVPSNDAVAIRDAVENTYGRWSVPANGWSAKYMVFHEGSHPSAGGFGFGWFGDSSKSSANTNMQHTSTAITYVGAWWTYTTLHELTHALGGVHYDAPYATSGAHTYKSNDVMGYNDGTSQGQNWGSQAVFCPDGQSQAFNWTFNSSLGYPYDCHGGAGNAENVASYADARIANRSSSYLATHFNVFGAENPFVVQGVPGD